MWARKSTPKSGNPEPLCPLFTFQDKTNQEVFIFIRKAKYERIGESRVMNSGLIATIIRYETSKNMDIQFENGLIRCHVFYQSFLAGEIKCPLLIEYIDNYAKITNANTKDTWLMDIEDIYILNNNLWHSTDLGYIQRNAHPGWQILHRIIMNAPDDIEIDHIDGDTKNCRKYNMRFATRSENNRNQRLRKDNSSGFKGVHWNKYANKWIAQINVDKKHYCLGRFKTVEEAVNVYNEAAVKYHKEFAKLNITNGDSID